MNQMFHAFEIMVPMLCYLIYAFAAQRFCNTYLETTKAKERAFAAFIFCGCLMMGIVSEKGNLLYIVSALLTHIYILGLVVLLFEGKIEKKILAAAILIIIKVLVWNFAESFLSCLVLVFLHYAKHETAAVMELWEIELITCVTYIIGILFMKWMSEYLIPLFCFVVKRWYILLAFPLYIIVLIVDMVNFAASNGVLFHGGESWNLFYNQIFSHLAICILTMFFMCAAGFYLFGMQRIYVEQRKKEQYQSQLKYYEMLHDQYRQMERLRHDMKNHVIAMQGLVENREWDKARSYLSRMEMEGELRTGDDITGNTVIDALLYQKKKRAVEKNIIWSCDMQLFPKWTIDEFDLCVLLGNILDNSLESCERLGDDKECVIDIQSREVKNCFLFAVKNSADICDVNETRYTTKNLEKHGIGMLNIEDVVHKYNGILEKKLHDGLFEITVLLPMSRDE